MLTLFENLKKIIAKMLGSNKVESKHLTYAIIFATTAALFYSIMNTLVKLVANDTTQSMTVFFRFMVSLFWLALAFSYKHFRGKHFTIKTNHFGMHLLRAASGFIAIFSLYYSLKYIPLADATSLTLTYTLFIPILGAIFLGTKTSLKNWMALIAGFIGILFILQPYGSSFQPATLIALLSGLAASVSFLGVHELAKSDKPHTILLYYFPLTFILSGIFTIFDWKNPSMATLIDLILIGVVGTVYQELLTRALLYAPPKTISPLLYLSIIFSTVFDWMFWDYVPNLYFWVGVTLVGLSCIFSIKYATSRNVATPQPDQNV